MAHRRVGETDLAGPRLIGCCVKAGLLEMPHQVVRRLIVMIEQHADLQDPGLAFVVVGKGVDREYRVASAPLHHRAHGRVIRTVETIDSALAL